MSVCAILLSYKRPQNMDRIIRNALESKYIDKIILSNNNPEVNLTEWLSLEEYDIELINQPVPTLYTKRWEIASERDYPFFFCPDDDLFLTAEQIDYVLEALFTNPAVPHGIAGQIKCFRQGKPFLDSDVVRVDSEVDVLNRCYFFSKAHIETTLRLAKEVGYSNINEARYMEDGLMSFSGASRPLIHDVGELASCPTSVQKGVATWREDEFTQTRINGYLKLQALTGRN